MGQKQLTTDSLEQIAGRFRTLSEVSRLTILMQLRDGEMNVSQLVEATKLTQANTSRHLQVLTESGILGRRKVGLNVYYYIADKSVFKLCDHVCGSLKGHLDKRAKAFA